MSRLLSDEQLRYQLCMKLGYDDRIKGQQPVILLGSDIGDIIDLINTQKRQLLQSLKESIELQRSTRYTEEGWFVAIESIDRYIEVVSE